MNSQIVVPLDGTQAAERAIPAAVAMANTTGSAITLVRAINPVLLYHPACRAELVPIVYERSQEEWQVAGDYLRKLAGQLSGRGIQPACPHRVWGPGLRHPGTSTEHHSLLDCDGKQAAQWYGSLVSRQQS